MVIIYKFPENPESKKPSDIPYSDTVTEVVQLVPKQAQEVLLPTHNHLSIIYELSPIKIKLQIESFFEFAHASLHDQEVWEYFDIKNQCLQEYIWAKAFFEYFWKNDEVGIFIALDQIFLQRAEFLLKMKFSETWDVLEDEVFKKAHLFISTDHVQNLFQQYIVQLKTELWIHKEAFLRVEVFYFIIWMLQAIQYFEMDTNISFNSQAKEKYVFETLQTRIIKQFLHTSFVDEVKNKDIS